MGEIISNTSPLQYLHQLRMLELLPQLFGKILVPTEVVDELAEGRAQGLDLPEPRQIPWMSVVGPCAIPPALRDLGCGEASVLTLALQHRDSTVLLDDGAARRAAKSLNLRMKGTLGVLLIAKQRGLVEKVSPILDDLDRLRFRLHPETRAAVLRLAGEAG